MIPEGTKMFLMQLARSSPEREICGFLFQDWTVWPIRNISEGSSEFEMDHEETILVFESRYDQLMGVYHSHPGGTAYPSWDDVRHAPPNLRYFIVTTTDVIEWRISDDKSTVERADPRSPQVADAVPECTNGHRQDPDSGAGARV